MHSEENNVVTATKSWLEQIIIGLNFCPFAKKEFVNNTICYHVSKEKKQKAALLEFVEQCQILFDDSEIETTLLIYQDGFRDFNSYLDLVDNANDLLIEQGFEGVFQLASMHPEYCFADEDFDDASNYTNRSPYPIIHIIREESMARVLSVYKNPEEIPENNIALAQQKGSAFFEKILAGIRNR